MRRIWETIADIPQGCVANYGQVAEIAGIPRGARQVGYALRHVPDGLDLPWHRVIQASGRSAFAPDSAAYRRQRDRLAREGVAENCELDVRRLDAVYDRRQPRVLQRLAEFGNVGSRDECPALADDHQGLGGVLSRRLQGLHDALANGLGKRIDGRIIDADDADIACKCVFHGGRHEGSFANSGTLGMV